MRNRRDAEHAGERLAEIREGAPRSEVDAGARPGTTTQEAVEIKALKREVAELRRANDILKSAASFFAAELDRPQPRS